MIIYIDNLIYNETKGFYQLSALHILVKANAFFLVLELIVENNILTLILQFSRDSYKIIRLTGFDQTL